MYNQYTSQGSFELQGYTVEQVNIAVIEEVTIGESIKLYLIKSFWDSM